ncbi:hypothetical protein AQUCO_13500015v1 [Aquilegia coerulea]|uniref:Uncharacterized protein n=1 Tax=Aquilegia coerulea TaxID=218851 RepID=A0A2G5C139_AQUCA|nr:hypothetical protein AQUCO_13500015v1 [Aquilegia coerulea]
MASAAACKRKADQVEEETNNLMHEEEEESTTKFTINKRRRVDEASSSSSTTEYFPEKRKMDDLWKSMFLVGTEWHTMESLYNCNWDFSNLENAFEEENGGLLYGKRVYLFSYTEGLTDTINCKAINVPVVVAVVSPFPPSDKIAVCSVQLATEEIISMKKMKMDWIPYVPLAYRDKQASVEYRLNAKSKESSLPQIFVLSCTETTADLRNLELESHRKYEYCVPYYYNPLVDNNQKISTCVDIVFPAEPAPVFYEYDWEDYDLEIVVDELVDREELSGEDQIGEFRNFVRQKVREAKRANREAEEARKKAIEEMDEETKAAYSNIKIYKIYPLNTPEFPPLPNKTLQINRFYGKADEYI